MRRQLKNSLGRSKLFSIAMLISIVSSNRINAAENFETQSRTYDWSGVYLGVQAGFGNTTIIQDITIPAINHYWRGNSNDWLAGGYIGINFQSDNNLVLGFEGDWNFTDISKTLRYDPDPTNLVQVQIDNVASLRARMGGAVDNLLVYGTIGLAWMNGTHDQVLIPTNTIDDNLKGWVVGGGINYGLDPNWSLKIEYLRYSFSENFPQNAQGTTQVAHDYDIDMNVVNIGVAYKF